MKNAISTAFIPLSAALVLVLVGCVSWGTGDVDTILPTPNPPIVPSTAKAMEAVCKRQSAERHPWNRAVRLVWDYSDTVVRGINCQDYNLDAPLGLWWAFTDICDYSGAVVALREALVSEGLRVPESCERGRLYVARARKSHLEPIFEEQCLHRKSYTSEAGARCRSMSNELDYLDRVVRGHT